MVFVLYLISNAFLVGAFLMLNSAKYLKEAEFIIEM
jgi:hypothetical protein